MLTEHKEQVIVVQWAKRNTKIFPELKWLHAIPNGGLRDIRTASKLKLEGVKSGVFDLFLPVSMRGYHGLYIEMKRERGGQLSDKQKEFIEDIGENGYFCFVAKGAGPAIDCLKQYLAQDQQG